ncbi:MAG: hypothetical protein HY791_11950 [Deltaproteobacteria bacterium]|nr:hypothetical protein [Deltaproteobacteria bacterium]
MTIGHRSPLLLVLMISSWVGCASDPTPTPTPVLDAGVEVDGGVVGVPDAGFIELPPGSVAISGSIYRLDDYLRGENVPLSPAVIKPLGVAGVPISAPDPQGRYSVIVPQNGKVVFAVEKDNHVTTYEEISVGDKSILKNFLVSTKIWVDIVAAAYGTHRTAPFPCHAPNPTTSQCKFAFVAGQLLDDGTDGQGTPAPVAGVTKDDFEITVDGQPVYVKGPYFLAANGNTQANLTSSVRERNPPTMAYRGGLFFVFVELPIETTQAKTVGIKVQTEVPTARTLGPVVAKIYLQDLSYVKLYQTAAGVPPPPPPPPPPNGVDFDTVVYPLLLPVTEGGYGCLGCHTSAAGNPSGGMDLSGGPAAAYAALDPARYPQRVDTQVPAQSKLLTKPLYEADGVQDHAIFAFVSAEDPGYQAIYGWIQQGAKRVGGPGNPQPPPNVSFYGEVRPLLYKPAAEGGFGCVDCHSGAEPPGGFSVDGDANALHLELTSEAAQDGSQTGEPYRINKRGEPAKSLVLLNPLQGSPEGHPVKLIPSAADPRYRAIYTWISQGYTNDSP